MPWLRHNDAQVHQLHIQKGGGAAGLCGSMLPPEFLSGTLQTMFRLTPHRWAYDALADIQRHNGTLANILPQLGVLAARALALLALGHSCSSAASAAPRDANW